MKPSNWNNWRSVFRFLVGPLGVLTILLAGALLLAGPLSLVLAGGPPLQSTLPASMKGYELYSWQMDGDWYFSLLIGTNRLKTYDEITARAARIRGIEALKDMLGKLPQGEWVFWSIGQGIAGLALPPGEVLDDVSAYCAQRGIQLEIIR